MDDGASESESESGDLFRAVFAGDGDGPEWTTFDFEGVRCVLAVDLA